MTNEGKYIYCIISSEFDRHFGPIGIGGRDDEVLTIGHEDLSMVVSNHPLTKIHINSKDMITHVKVIEEVMKGYDSVLPVRFGTIAADVDEIRNLLDRRYREFKSLLRDMNHKIELGLKGLWNNMDLVFNEILIENEEIRETKALIQKKIGSNNIKSRIGIGKLINKALQKKKLCETKNIISKLQRVCVDFRLNKSVNDEMFMNAAFLVDKGREKEFDNIMDELNDKHQEKIIFKYTGPLPVFNFTNIVMYPESWEK